MATFGFGRLVDHEGRNGPVKVPEYRPHIQETWRITNGESILLGRRDWQYPPRNSTVAHRDFREEDEARNLQDDLRDDWLAHGAEAHVVDQTRGFETGDIRISFVDGCMLETFTSQVAHGEDGEDEFWRLLPPESVDGHAPHFVVTARGAGLE
jgi:hypothetical protein